MDKTLIALNVPNFITIAVMAILAWLLAGLLWQTVKKYVPDNIGDMMGAGAATASNDGGY